MKTSILAYAAVFATVGFAASAATMSFTASVDSRPADFTSTVSVNQFDSSLGTLESVEVVLTGMVSGSARAENANPHDVTIDLGVDATIAASALGRELVAVIPSYSRNGIALSAFDGGFDFGGTSGVTYDDLSATANDSTVLTDASDLAAFAGTGMIDLAVGVVVNAFGPDNGNVASLFNTNAGANIEVIYTYSEVTDVPVPASLPLLAGALGLAALVRRRT